MKRLESIQHLRGIAAMLVVFVHFPTPLARFSGSIGVDIFFFISGFIIFTSIEKSGYYDKPLVFFKKRLLRIVPLYFMVITGFIIMNLLLNAWHAERISKIPVNLDRSYIIRSFLFIPIEDRGLYSDPVVFLGWSLNFEMLFYVITFFSLVVFRKKFFIPLLLSLFGLYMTGKLAGGFTNVYLDFFTSSFLIYFLAGLLVGKYQKFLSEKLAPFCEPLFFVAVYGMFVVMMATDSGIQQIGITRELVFYNDKLLPRELVWGLPALLFFLAYFILCEKYGVSNRYLKSLGDRSYSVYLLQIFFIYILLEFWNLFTRVERIGVSLILIILLVWLSGITYKYFEKRFHK